MLRCCYLLSLCKASVNKIPLPSQCMEDDLHRLWSGLHTILDYKARTVLMNLISNTQSQGTESSLTLNPFITEEKDILLCFTEGQ